MTLSRAICITKTAVFERNSIDFEARAKKFNKSIQQLLVCFCKRIANFSSLQTFKRTVITANSES